MEIHPTAIVAEGAKLGSGVKIGPYAIIEDQVEIGDNCVIDSHAIIREYVTMGSGNHIHPHVVIGGVPQDISFDPQTKTCVVIGDNNTIREGTTIHRSTKEEVPTQIGSNCYIMTQIHIGHDCAVGDHCIMASYTALGGHVKVGHHANFGAAAKVHQFVRIGPFTMIAAAARVIKDVLPYTLLEGEPSAHYRLNLIGLRRNGIDAKRIKVLSLAFAALKKKEKLEDLDLTETPEITFLKEWLAEKSTRGLSRFVSLKK